MIIGSHPASHSTLSKGPEVKYHLTHKMTNKLHNYPVTSRLPNDKGASQLPWVTNTTQVKHHRIIVKRICHFVSQIILYLGPLLQCTVYCIEGRLLDRGGAVPAPQLTSGTKNMAQLGNLFRLWERGPDTLGVFLSFYSFVKFRAGICILLSMQSII
jgi:hypothetical protein